MVEVSQHCAELVASACCHTSDVRDLIHRALEVPPGGLDCTIAIAGVECDQQDRNRAGLGAQVLSAVPRLVAPCAWLRVLA